MNIFLGIVALIVVVFFLAAFFLLRYLKTEESIVIAIFLQKVSKIPALIEVMRPFVAKEESFDSIVAIHTEAMIQECHSIYDILGLNGRLQNDFLFLMQLSVQIPELQKNEYFVYIRNFVIEYERMMRSHFGGLNKAIQYWNTFVKIKNMTVVGLVFPWRKRMEVR